MGRRSGQRLVAAKAFIGHQLRNGHAVTVADVMKEFPEVATCRSIYRWIAHAKRAVENPGQVNRRSQARQFINDLVQRGTNVRVCDVLVRFPNVASTTTVYRWLHEAKRPTQMIPNPRAFVWHVIDNDPTASPTSSQQVSWNGSPAPTCTISEADTEHWDRVKVRHAQLVASIESVCAPGHAFDEHSLLRLRSHILHMFPDAPAEIINRRIHKRIAGPSTPSMSSGLSSLVDVSMPVRTRMPMMLPMHIPAPGQVLTPTAVRADIDRPQHHHHPQEGTSREGLGDSPASPSMHLCCDCGRWLQEHETEWISLHRRPQPWAVANRFPVSAKFVHTRRSQHGDMFVTICCDCIGDKTASAAAQLCMSMDVDAIDTDMSEMSGEAGEEPDVPRDIGELDGREKSTALALLDLYTSA